MSKERILAVLKALEEKIPEMTPEELEAAVEYIKKLKKSLGMK